MKQRFLKFSAALCAALLLASPAGVARVSAQAAELPALTQPVNDLANVIDAPNAAAMDQMIRSLQAATGDVVIVASVKTFAPYGSIEEFAVKLYERAGIGVKGKDNGVLILVAVDDRRARIEVGYGLEGPITDGFSGDVIRTAMLPAFRRGAYGDGLRDATTLIVERIAKERNITLANLPEPPQRRRQNVKRVGSIVPIIFVILLVLFIMGRSGGSGRRGGGGSGLLGFLIGQALANAGRRGGGWNGGGFGGGGFGGGLGGGGFGGFGGGRSGGGGASGGW